MVRIASSLVLVAAILACSPSVRALRIADPFPAYSADSPVSVWSVDLPDCPFQELGLVTVVEDGLSGDEGFLEILKDEARDMGGHALIGLRDIFKSSGDGAAWGISATVVRFTDPGCGG